MGGVKLHSLNLAPRTQKIVNIIMALSLTAVVAVIIFCSGAEQLAVLADRGDVANLPNAIKAGFWMMGAMISFTLMAISGRSLADKLDTFEIMTFRSFIGIAIVLFFAFWH